MNRFFWRARGSKLSKFWVRNEILGVFGAVLENFKGDWAVSQRPFRVWGPVCTNKFLAQKLFVVSRGINSDLAYFLRKLLRSENFKAICVANGDYVTWEGLIGSASVRSQYSRNSDISFWGHLHLGKVIFEKLKIFIRILRWKFFRSVTISQASSAPQTLNSNRCKRHVDLVKI